MRGAGSPALLARVVSASVRALPKRGADRNRTGVRGFAGLCLTTRPPRPATAHRSRGSGGDLADDARRVADGHDVRREVARDDGARADDGIVADGDARADDRTTPEPDVVAERDRLARLPPRTARFRVDRVRRRQQLDARAELARGAD